jgi:hypothetical protein
MYFCAAHELFLLFFIHLVDLSRCENQLMLADVFYKSDEMTFTLRRNGGKNESENGKRNVLLWALLALLEAKQAED